MSDVVARAPAGVLRRRDLTLNVAVRALLRFRHRNPTVDTEHQGSNRFATILLYMSDLNEGDGGETVFTHAWPVGQPEEERVPFERALADLRAAGDVAGLLQPDSWQEQMVARCRSRLAVRPHSSRAVLFYSQHPDGTPDNASMHGGCPVISGEKWAASEYAAAARPRRSPR